MYSSLIDAFVLQLTYSNPDILTFRLGKEEAAEVWNSTLDFTDVFLALFSWTGWQDMKRLIKVEGELLLYKCL